MTALRAEIFSSLGVQLSSPLESEKTIHVLVKIEKQVRGRKVKKLGATETPFCKGDHAKYY